jgi:hypothetical protein
VELEEVPNEKATVERFGALKELYRGRHLAVRSLGQQKKQTRGSGGSRKKLATARGQLTRHAIPARVRGTLVGDKARTRLCQEPRKNGRLGRDIGRNRNS